MLQESVASVLPMATKQIFSAGNYVIVIKGVHDVATDTSAKTRKVEDKLNALMNLVTQLAMSDHNSRGQTLDIEDSFQLLVVSVQEMMPLSLEEFTTWLQIHLLKLESFSARNDAIVISGVHDVATDTSAETRKVEGKLEALVNLVTQFAMNQKPASVARVCGIRLPMTNIPMSSSRPRKVEGKLDALVNLVTQLVVNQKPISVARVCGIRSSNDHHTNRRWLPNPSSFSARNDAIVIRVVHDIATDTSAETRNVEGKVDALVNLVTQLAQPGVNEHLEASATNIYSRPPQQGVHDVATDTSSKSRKEEGNLDALVNLVTLSAVSQKPASVARVCGIRHHNSRGQTLDREDGFQLLPVSVQEMMTMSLEEFTTWLQIHLLKLERKVEGKQDALGNLVTQLAVNQKPASVASALASVLPMTTIQMSILLRSNQDFCARNDVIVVRGVHDVARDTSAETRKLEGKLDALVNFGARNDTIVIRGVHDVATDTSAETRKVEGNLDALVNLVTQLGVNQKSASVARQPGLNEHPEAYAANTYSRPPQQQRPVTFHDVAIDISAETRKVEGKLDALVNLVTQLAVNQKPAFVARVWGIRVHNSRGQTLDREDGLQFLAVLVQEMMPLSLEEFTTWPQIYLLKQESFSARNDALVIRGVHDVAIDISAETRKVEGKLDALVNLVTQLAASTATEARHLIKKMASNSKQFRGVHDVATDTSAEARKVEGKLDAFVNLVSQLVVNQKPASVARVYGIVLPMTTIQIPVLLHRNLE
ncbi:hypothetical protein Fmac_024836 [Flemingia macrophylla]|uniref:FH2 domain-containing protein n=1 Tax=Flemingia macrophylla TaxID=520843 RepID=A0ABD1LQL6_9FABA